MPKKVIAYIRVSTSEQADKGYSLPHQESVIKSFCDLHKYEIQYLFKEDYSAKTFDRPEWKRLQEYVKVNKKNVDLVLCLKWDRFSRNTGEAIDIIKKFRNDYGIEINTVQQPIDFSNPDSKLLLNIYLTVPEIENDKNSERTIAGSRQARLEGCWTGSAPFGYRNIRTADGKSTLEKNTKAEIVKEAFEMFSEGYHSAEAVRKVMCKKGLKMNKMSFLSLLRNPAYMGKIYVKQYRNEEAILVQGLHEPIIDSQMFNKVSRILSDRKKKKVTNKPQNVIELPLRGHLRCKVCGRTLTGSRSKGRNNSYYYYHCNSTKCNERFRADTANVKFEEHLENYFFEPEVVTLYGEILNDCFAKEENNQDKLLLEYEERIEKINNKLSNIQDLLADSQISVEDYNQMKTKYTTILNDVIMEFTQVKMAIKQSKERLNETVSIVRDLKRFYEQGSFEVKRQIIGSIFPEKLEFEKGEYRTTRVNSFFEILAQKQRVLKGYKRKNASNVTGVYCEAPPSGLEPETL